MSDNPLGMTRARTFAGLVAGSAAGGHCERANAKPDAAEAGNGRGMQRWVLKGTKPASSVQPPVQER
jgi:hypothetical protein